MKKLVPLTLGLICALAITATAAEKKAENRKPLTAEQKAARKELIAKYDTNKDGKLDKEERAKMTKEDKAKMAELAGRKAKKEEAK